MHKKSTTIYVFGIFLFLSILVFLIAKIPFLGILATPVNFIASPFQHGIFSLFHMQSDSADMQKLREENISLQKKLIDEKKLIAENNALKDQFQAGKPASSHLLPVEVIGAPGFMPGVSQPDMLIINAGERNGVSKGQAVVVNNNLVGYVDRVSYNLAVVLPIISSHLSFTARELETNATGLVTVSENGLQLEGVLLSDTLKKDDYIVTKGDVDAKGNGFPPDIIVGQIVSIDKRPSALFQTAKIQPLIDLSKIRIVFIVQTKP